MKVPRFAASGKKLAAYWAMDATCLPTAADQLLKAVVAGDIALIADTDACKRTWERDIDSDDEGDYTSSQGDDEAPAPRPRTVRRASSSPKAAPSPPVVRPAPVAYPPLVNQDSDYADDSSDDDADDLTPPPLQPLFGVMPAPMPWSYSSSSQQPYVNPMAWLALAAAHAATNA